MRLPSLRRGRGKNPFTPDAADPATATTSADGTPVASPDAVAVLGEPVATAMAADVAASPLLLATVDNTASGVDPATVTAPQVSLYSNLLDTSLSATSFFPVIAYGHDTFLDALMPAVGDGIAILVTCMMLDGTIVYPLTLVGDAPRFGRQPVGTVKEVTRGSETIKVDAMGNLVEDNGLTYSHVSQEWSRCRYITKRTLLRDRVKEQITSLCAEALNWANPTVARTVRMISATITDGLDIGSRTTPAELNDLVGELESNGNFTEVATFIGDLENPDFRNSLIRNVIFNQIDWDELRGIPKDQWADKFAARVLPQGHELMSDEDLLRWWFYEQGLAAERGRLFPVGTNPKEIRRGVGDMSQTAYQQSGVAYEDENDQ